MELRVAGGPGVIFDNRMTDLIMNKASYSAPLLYLGSQNEFAPWNLPTILDNDKDERYRNNTVRIKQNFASRDFRLIS